MLADFPVLYVDAIVRRTIGSCIVLAVLSLIGGLLAGQILAGVGVVVGLAGATLNHRLFQSSTVKHISPEGRLDRKPFAGSVAVRLGALTLLAFVLVYLVRPMGFGMVGGLVAFQLFLVANSLAVLWRYQRQQLGGPVGGHTAQLGTQTRAVGQEHGGAGR